MTPQEILDLLRTAGHGEHADVLRSLIQPAFRIVATPLAPRPGSFRQTADTDGMDPAKLDAFEAALTSLPIGASRFGGVPDLPPGVAWPARDGVPMEFIAQIRLADVDGDERLPRTGNLAFFYNSQWETSDTSSEDACAVVIFHDGADEVLERASPPRIEWKSEFAETTQLAPFLHGLASLRFEPTFVVPGGVSPFTQPLASFWQDFICEYGQAIDGNEKPFTANRLLGYVDEQDYVEAHANGTEDQLLLQVDSDGAAEFQFGDCNKLFFLLTKRELAACDFSRVRVYSSLG